MPVAKLSKPIPLDPSPASPKNRVPKPESTDDAIAAAPADEAAIEGLIRLSQNLCHQFRRLYLQTTFKFVVDLVNLIASSDSLHTQLNMLKNLDKIRYLFVKSTIVINTIVGFYYPAQV